MSQQNVEVARRYLQGTEEGMRGIEAINALVDEFWEPDGDYYPVRRWPEARPCHGRAEIVRFLSAIYPAWENYRYAIKDARAVGDDRVLVYGEIRAAGRASGVALEGATYHCFWLRHGRFIRVEDHLTAKGALHALGLSGEALETTGLQEWAVSQENVEVVRRIFEAFSRGDVEGGIVLADTPPEFEFVPSGAVIPDLASVQRGPEAFRRVVETFTAEFDDPRVELHELIDAGDQVFTSFTLRGRGKHSGVEASWDPLSVWTVRNGRLVRWLGFTDRDAALEAAGLQE
jgi:ketosteroid isomerase-like protein